MKKVLLMVLLCLLNEAFADSIRHNSHCGSSEWIAYKNTCLLRSKTQFSWNNANLFCKNQSAKMVKIESNEKFLFIRKILNKTSDTNYAWVINF